MSAIKNRVVYWDNLKGLLIFLVVVGHFWLDASYRSVLTLPIVFIFAFHMPFFTYISGYFASSKVNVKSVVKLLCLYIIGNILCYLFFSSSLSNVWKPAYHTWYLLALLVWRFVTPYIAKEKWSLLLSVILSIVIGFCPIVDNVLCVSRILVLYPFFLFGYKCRFGYCDFLNHWKFLNFLCAFSGAIVSFCCIFVSHNYSRENLLFFPYAGMSDMIYRIFVFLFSFCMIVVLRLCMVNKRLLFLSNWGQYSLWIYFFHRFIVLGLNSFMNGISRSWQYVFISIVFSVVICCVFGNPWVGNILNRFIDKMTDCLLNWDKWRRFGICCLAGFLCVMFIWCIVWKPAKTVIRQGKELPIMSKEMREKYDDAFCISYVGDLILLEEQVQRAYRNGLYVFDDVFEYTRPYIEQADVSIGVLEGPLAGDDEYSYSVGNFDDGKDVRLNYPDDFALTVRDVGFDLVTIANNHIFDCGMNGFLRTIHVLDGIGLSFVGGVNENHDRVVCKEYDGLKIAFIAYTYGLNYITDSELLYGDYSKYVPVATYSSGIDFWKLRSQVKSDFVYAKSLNPDLIIVLPHMGTQFSNCPDDVQESWFDFFKECGADIVLGDHSHSVQPVVLDKADGHSYLGVYSPGNFVNRYRENQGDTSVLVNIYIDRKSYDLLGYGIVPLYTTASVTGNFRAIPIYDLIQNLTDLSLSVDDVRRAQDGLDIILNVLFDTQMSVYNVAKEYVFDGNDIYRWYDWNDCLFTSDGLVKELSSVDTVCFIGDSLTDGMKNDGVGWYVPLVQNIDVKVDNLSMGGWTTHDVVQCLDNVPLSDMYVVAIGVNDFRYAVSDVNLYMNNMSVIYDAICSKNHDAKIVCVAPWFSREGDSAAAVSYQNIVHQRVVFGEKLKEFCEKKNIVYVDINGDLESIIRNSPPDMYLLDWIHPNVVNGVRLYAKLVDRGYADR